MKLLRLSSSRRARPGFALIISLSLMTLLLLLVLTLAILVRLELQTAKGNLYTEEAKQNAILAAYIGIGQLQKFAGPDQRITTTADLGNVNETNRRDPAMQAITGKLGGFTFPAVNSPAEGAVTPMPAPFGTTNDWLTGGTRYWTVVWGEGTNPLAIYTGQDLNSSVSKTSPMPILMNYLVSGDESTPIVVNTNNNGSVVPQTINITFTADTGDIQKGINSASNNDQSTWSPLTTDITITPKNGLVTPQPAVLLVGPNTAATDIGNQSISIFPGNSSGSTFSALHREITATPNLIVVPLVNINVPEESTSNITAGRYAFWVADEGVKAKYNVADAYANANNSAGYASNPAAAGSPARYRMNVPERTGIERMYNMDSYYNSTTSVAINNPNVYNGTLASQLGQVLDPSQVLLADHNLADLSKVPGTIPDKDLHDPRKTLQLHYHDFTTYSYGVLSDALRGGLRYDLTAAFEPGTASAAVFNPSGTGDKINGLKGKSILPANAAANNFINPTTTEPAVATGLAVKSGTPNVFHGPAAPDPAVGATPGIKWDLLQSYYNLATQTTFTSSTAAVTIWPGNATTVGISPVILQARLKFGETVDSSQFQYVAVEPIFVLGNPYNFPITPPVGGLDLGFRITSNTGWEWGFHAIARNNDRVGIHSSGVGVYLGYDNTQNSTLANLNTISGGSNDLTRGYGGAYFFSKSAVTQITANVTTPFAGGTGFGVKPGYYPIVKNPVSYTSFVSSIPGAPGSAGNTKYNSVLDQVAFHIPRTLPNGGQLIFQPGESIVFTLADEKDSINGGKNLTSNFQPDTTHYNQLSGVNRKIVAVVGTLGSTSAEYYLTAQQIVPVLLQPGSLASNQHYYMLRYTGIKSDFNNIVSYANTTTALAALNLAGNMDTDVVDYIKNTSYFWPDPQYGYISTMWPSVAATLELRADTAPVTITRAGDFGTMPLTVNASAAAGSLVGIAGPGQNVLQTITNFDLSGAGISSSNVYPSPTAYLPPNPSQGYRRQFINSGGGVTEPTASNGVLPVVLASYEMSMALPGNMDPLYFAQDTGGNSNNGQTNFDPAVQVSYRTYMDFNIRAVNLSLPPTNSLNKASTAGGTSTTADFLTSPPFGRIWNQGPGNDDSVPSSYNTADDLSFNTKDVGPNLGTFTNLANQPGDSPWGNSLATQTGGAFTGGQQYFIQFAIPSRVNGLTNVSSGVITAGGSTAGSISSNAGASLANVPNPIPGGPQLPDVPMISLGQLQHADVTGDDVWLSVGYQRGNAIGNSYYTPFVDRSTSMVMKPNLSGKTISKLTSVSGNTATYTFPFASTASLGVYDISYIMNCALFDRYFFSALAQGQTTSTVSANSRLKFAAGIVPTAKQMGLGQNSAIVTDPVTKLQMFRAYAPARYMLIDGAFNINSTSVEAWKAVLSSLRSVALTTSTGTGTDSGQPVAYFSHVAASTNMVSATVASKAASMTSLSIYQPLRAGPTFNNTPGSGNSFGADAPSYAGFRELSDQDIDLLAMKIVQQVRLRGPFLSLAQFVNRRLTPQTIHNPSYLDPLSWSGALQTALDINTNTAATPSNSFNNFYLSAISSASSPFSPTSINTTLLPVDSALNASATQTYPEGPKQFQASPYPLGSADPTSRLVGMPGWLTQADLLESLAPILAVRSDTFVIRTYGEVLDSQANQKNLLQSISQNPTLILSRAWCEVVVQRVPDYLDTAILNDPSTTVGVNAPNPGTVYGNPALSKVNIAFGRRFKIVSVRWLSAEDI